jgi:hypothetical protein
MSLIVPITIQTAVIQEVLSADLKLRLYSNNYSPSVNSVIGSFTEVSGGGYAAEDLLSADWVYGTVSPVAATQTVKTFGFSGATASPSTVYGYYVTNVAGSVLYWAEAFSTTYFPFEPSNGAYIRIFPRFAVSGGAVGS